MVILSGCTYSESRQANIAWDSDDFELHLRTQGGESSKVYGTIEIESSKDSGTRISVTLPSFVEDTKEFVTNPREKKKEDSIDVVESKVIGGTRIKLDTLKQIIWDYFFRIMCLVFCGADLWD